MIAREELSLFTDLLEAGASVPFGQRGLVHVWGKNNMTTSQRMGISWTVKDPAGVIVESYTDWEATTTGPGATHEFIGGRFDLNKVGTWTIFIGLFMNFAAPVMVASYGGDLCVVAAEVYKGSISKKELEYDSVRGAIPVL